METERHRGIDEGRGQPLQVTALWKRHFPLATIYLRKHRPTHPHSHYTLQSWQTARLTHPMPILINATSLLSSAPETGDNIPVHGIETRQENNPVARLEFELEGLKIKNIALKEELEARERRKKDVLQIQANTLGDKLNGVQLRVWGRSSERPNQVQGSGDRDSVVLSASCDGMTPLVDGPHLLSQARVPTAYYLRPGY